MNEYSLPIQLEEKKRKKVKRWNRFWLFCLLLKNTRKGNI